PARGEVGRCHDREGACRGAGARDVDGGDEMAEAVAHMRQHGRALGRELERAREPPEERDAKVILEQLHLAAHGPGRHVQLARRDGEAQVACGRLEGAQRVQGRGARSSFLHDPAFLVGCTKTNRLLHCTMDTILARSVRDQGLSLTARARNPLIDGDCTWISSANTPTTRRCRSTSGAPASNAPWRSAISSRTSSTEPCRVWRASPRYCSAACSRLPAARGSRP